MPVVASATLEVTPVLAGAQQSLTEQLTNAAGPAAEKAGEESGSKMSGSLVKGIAKGSALVAGAVAAVGGAMVGAASQTAEYGDNIDKMSQKLGLSAEAYQQWDYVLGQSGTDIDKMATGMKTLTNKLDDAKNGSAGAQEMFAKLGLSMEDINGMTREDVFEAAIRGFQGMADSTERAALANDLFGKSGQELTPLFNTSIEDTEALLQASKDLGFVMSNDAVKASADFRDELDTMQRTFGGIKNGLAAQLLPTMSDFMGKISDFIATTDLSPLTDTFGKAFSALSDFISGLDIDSAGTTFQNIIKGVGDAVSLAWGVIQTVFGALQDGIGTVSDAMGNFGISWGDVWGGVSSVIETVAGIVSSAIGLISQAIAWLVTEAQTDGTVFNTIWENIKTVVQSACDIIKGVIQMVSSLLKGDWRGAWESAKSIVTTALNGIRTICSNVWNNIKSTASSVWNGIKSAITGPIESAKNTISGILSRIKGMFPLSIGRIFSGLTLPHISVSGGEAPFGIGGKGSLPHFSVQWYAKAMSDPYVFTNPTIIGAGEAGDEMLYGREALLRDIKEATGGRGVTNYITVNGAEDPEAWASKFARQIKMEMRMA